MFWNKQGNKQSQQYWTGSKEEGGARDDRILRKKKIMRIIAPTSLLLRNCLFLVIPDGYGLQAKGFSLSSSEPQMHLLFRRKGTLSYSHYKILRITTDPTNSHEIFFKNSLCKSRRLSLAAQNLNTCSEPSFHQFNRKISQGQTIK